jgi:lipopolysaccharide export system permease protein
VFRAFALALLTMTIIFVLFMVAAEALRSRMLGPADVLNLVPFVIPSTLPYTVPVSLLFAVTVVYGRIAGDNEIIAVKSAGVSVMAVIWPTIFLGAAASGVLWHANRTWIPESAHNAKLVLFKDIEDFIYKFLKRDKELSLPNMPFFIKVQDVVGRDLIHATIKKRAKNADNTDTFSATIQAEKARLQFDLDRKVVAVHLEGAEEQNHQGSFDVTFLPNQPLELPLEMKNSGFGNKSIQEHTNRELDAELAIAGERLANDRKRQAIGASLLFAAGLFHPSNSLPDASWGVKGINWQDVGEAASKNSYWKKRRNELETEKQLRNSMAFGSLLFVILGAPVGIRFAKRDFLSAFMTCFLPIIGLYYPLMLFGINMGKEGSLPPYQALWISNLVLAVLAGWVYPRIIKY